MLRVSVLATAMWLAIPALASERARDKVDRYGVADIELPFGSVGHPGGDCNDTDANIHPGQLDIVGNGIDDNCNGLADEAANGDPSTDGSDADGDNNTIAAGDCNDHNPAVHAGAVEIVGDLIDNNCNGLADEDENGNPSSDPVDHDGDGIPMAPDRIFLDGFEG